MSVPAFLCVVVVLYLLWYFAIRLSLKRLECKRSFSVPAVFQGEEGELIEIVRNDTPVIFPWLRLESRISPHLRLGSQENLDVNGQMYYCSLFTVMPHQQIRRRHRVRFLHRGAYDLGNATMTVGDLFGLDRISREQALHAPVLVYPRLLDPDQLPMALSLQLGELVRRQQLLEDPFLVRGLRPYQPGDPVRDIHWPATARTGETYVRIHDYSARSRLLVILNAQDHDLQWGNVMVDDNSEIIETGISIAATLCVHMLRAGLSAGFATNLPQGQDKESTVLLPSEINSDEESLLAAMARLEMRRTQPFSTFLTTFASQTDLDILILSRYDSESIRDSMRLLEQSGNQVTLHLLEGGSL